MNTIDPLGLYRIHDKVLGQGGFGQVLKAEGVDGNKYAIKRIPKAKSLTENIAREVYAGLCLNHPNVINYMTQFQDEESDYLVFEYIKGRTLLKYMEERDLVGLKERHARKIFTQMVEAVRHCHNRGVYHFDIKLDNIMIDKNDHITLIDFGLCDFVTMENNGLYLRKVGSEEYCPPEHLVHSSTPFSGEKVDIFCLGVCLYGMLSGNFPFDAKLRKEIVRHRRPHPQVRITFKASNTVQNLLHRMLAVDPDERATLREVLSHPWIQRTRWSW